MKCRLGRVVPIANAHSRPRLKSLINQRVRACRMRELALVLIASGLLSQPISATPISQVGRIRDAMLGSRPAHRCDLPVASLGLYRPPTSGESYKWYIIGGISLLLFQTLLVTRLVWERSRRRQAEAEAAVASERLRMAMEVGDGWVWDWDFKSGRTRRLGNLQTLFGITSGESVGQIDDFMHRIHPEDREFVSKIIADARLTRTPYGAEFRMVRDNGTERWVRSRGRFCYASNGDAERVLGMAVDITELKHVEHKLRESEERFRSVANTTPVLIWMSDTDKLCTYVNHSWLEFTGRPLETELGNGWAESVHPEDRRGCMETYTKAFDRRQGFQMEYRLLRHDGQYRWVLDTGVPRFDPNGTFEGYIGSCLDLTERKLAEESLSSVSRRLIEAQEEERTRIARELHDDISQQIALLAIELDHPKEFSGLDPEAQRYIDDVLNRIYYVGSQVQAISHRLHSSKLQYLGLLAACKSFCTELADQHKVQIDFAGADIPNSIPPEISICLFRILQEGLTNAVKYSGVRHFQVKLLGTAEEIGLNVRDSGKGFDVEAAMSKNGIGLISMRERAALAQGTIAIQSNPAHGTEIDVRVPLAGKLRQADTSRMNPINSRPLIDSTAFEASH
jgi:PAS domain S-box-containing protein